MASDALSCWLWVSSITTPSPSFLPYRYIVEMMRGTGSEVTSEIPGGYFARPLQHVDEAGCHAPNDLGCRSWLQLNTTADALDSLDGLDSR